MTLHRVRTQPGVELAVSDTGAGEPLLLLSGFGLSHEVWGPILPVLRGTYRIVAPDLRGTGASAKPRDDDYGLERHAADVLAVLDELRLDRLTILGWSLGGLVGVQIATRAPHRVRGLILLGSSGARSTRSESYPFGAGKDELTPVLARAAQGESARRAVLTAGVRRPVADEALDGLVRLQMQMPPWSFTATAAAYLNADQTAELLALPVPVAGIVGSRDPVTPPEAMRWVCTERPDMPLVILDGCGHYPVIEAPDQLAATVLELSSRFGGANDR